MTEHLGDVHPKTWKKGATCDTCQAHTAQTRGEVWRGSPLIGIVPGGSKDAGAYASDRDFYGGLDSYRNARADGIQPDRSDLKAVDAAQKRIKSQEAAIRKIKNVADLPDGMITALGVDRDVT